MRWYLVNFKCRGVLLIWIIVGQGSTALAVGTGGGCLDIFSLVCRFSFLSPPLRETARYRLKYCLKGPLSPKQPTNHLNDDTKYAPSYLSFQKYLRNQMFNSSHIPDYFLKGKKKLSILHARLRSNCSDLNEDLYLNHLWSDGICAYVK